MLINEIYLSCQGEGPDAGLPTVFVRFQGCNQSCSYCDSKYTWDTSGEILTPDEILKRISEFGTGCRRVYLTGGEPLIQSNLGRLPELLVNYSVTIATNGTLTRPVWWKAVTWDIDYKCPSSGVHVFNKSWITSGNKNRVKFVVSDEADLEFISKKVLEFRVPLRHKICPTLIVSPMIPVLTPRDTDFHRVAWFQRVWKFCVDNNLRYSLQMHRLVFGSQRGV